jgi:hypothetical protein
VGGAFTQLGGSTGTPVRSVGRCDGFELGPDRRDREGDREEAPPPGRPTPSVAVCTRSHPRRRDRRARVTLTIVVLVVVIVAPVGLLAGTVAGFVSGWVDSVLMRLTDIFLAFPRLILALAFVAALGPGIENAVIAIACTAWPPYARIARAETLTLRNSDLIAAIRLQGASTARII